MTPNPKIQPVADARDELPAHCPFRDLKLAPAPGEPPLGPWCPYSMFLATDEGAVVDEVLGLAGLEDTGDGDGIGPDGSGPSAFPEQPPPDPVALAPEAYLLEVLNTGGDILQSNRIGAVTLVTSYRELGHFESVCWNTAGPDPGRRDLGERILTHETLECANGFHYALAERLWAGPRGERTRERSGWYGEDVAALLRTWEGR